MTPPRTCRALALAGAFTCILAIPAAVHAQSTPQQSTAQRTQPSTATPRGAAPPATAGEESSQLPVSLDRIREGLQREPTLKIDFLDPTIPLFRTSVHEKGLTLEDYWKVGPDTAVSRMVRPSFASTWHHEFISMTTPKQQIAASAFGLFGNPVHPIGPPVAEITKALKSVFSKVERGRIRRQIQEELKEIEANKAQQTPPPSDPASKPPAPRNPDDPR